MTNSINFQQLRCFLAVAKEGNLTRAAQSLELSPSTLSEHIRGLEEYLGRQLLSRANRALTPTEFGSTIADYADQIFRLSKVIETASTEKSLSSPYFLNIGVGDVIPKLAVHKVAAPLLKLDQDVRLNFCEQRSLQIFAEFELKNIDLAITDKPFRLGIGGAAFEQYTFEAQVYLFGSTQLWNDYQNNYPTSLSGAPFLLPKTGTNLRRSIDSWFRTLKISPRIVAEFDDAASMRVFGQEGAGLFPATSLVKHELESHFKLRTFGSIDHTNETFYVLLSEKILKNPELKSAVTNITELNRSK